MSKANEYLIFVLNPLYCATCEILIQNVSLDCKFTMEFLSKTDADIHNFLFFSVDLHTNIASRWLLFCHVNLKIDRGPIGIPNWAAQS